MGYNFPTIVVNRGGKVKTYIARPQMDMSAVMDSIRQALQPEASPATAATPR